MAEPVAAPIAVHPAFVLKRLRLELGTWNAMLYVLSRLLHAGSRGRVRLYKYYIVAQPIVARASLRPDAKTVVTFTHAGDSLTESFPRPSTVISSRYANGAHCMSAKIADEFAGFIWWQKGRYEEDEVRCTYVLEDPERSVWDYDVYVEPRFRFGRTLARLWQAASEHLAAEGIQWSYSRISAFNPNSLGTHARLGMQTHRSVSFWVLGSLQITWLGTGQLLHVSSSDARRPELRLPTATTIMAARHSART